MKIDWDTLTAVQIPRLNDGVGMVSAKMFADPAGKIMCSRLPAGTSIGSHRHASSCEINYVIAGTGIAVCDGTEEILQPGMCHYCPQGSTHSICCTGAEDLVLFTVVPECTGNV